MWLIHFLYRYKYGTLEHVKVTLRRGMGQEEE
jgi:hypothetical protein